MSTYLQALPTSESKRETNRDLSQIIFGSIVEFKSYLRYLEKLLNKKPEWSMHIPKRSWRRHSAYLTCLHEIQRDR